MDSTKRAASGSPCEPCPPLACSQGFETEAAAFLPAAFFDVAFLEVAFDVVFFLLMHTVYRDLHENSDQQPAFTKVCIRKQTTLRR